MFKSCQTRFLQNVNSIDKRQLNCDLKSFFSVKRFLD
jgi:hypothetical protein